jgi:hypothetical protein
VSRASPTPAPSTTLPQPRPERSRRQRSANAAVLIDTPGPLGPVLEDPRFQTRCCRRSSAVVLSFPVSCRARGAMSNFSRSPAPVPPMKRDPLIVASLLREGRPVAEGRSATRGSFLSSPLPEIERRGRPEAHCAPSPGTQQSPRTAVERDVCVQPSATESWRAQVCRLTAHAQLC